MNFNAWALRKDIQLKALMLVLVERFGDTGFRLCDAWQEDEHAIGLCMPDNPGVIAYVHTYGQRENRFGMHLEYPDDLGSMIVHDNTGQEQLLELLSAHLDLLPLEETTDPQREDRTF